MSELDMNPATLPADARALYEKMAARRKAQGEGFGGPYLALLNHPELARRIEELGFFLKFEGALPRTVYQFIVLTVARATGAGFEWHDHIAHARAAGLPADVIDCIGSAVPPPTGADRSPMPAEKTRVSSPPAATAMAAAYLAAW